MAIASLLDTALKWKLTPQTQLPHHRLLPPQNHNPLFIRHRSSHCWTQKPKGFAKLKAMCSNSASEYYSGRRMSGTLLVYPKSSDQRRARRKSSPLVGAKAVAIFWSVILLGSILFPELVGVVLIGCIFLSPMLLAFSAVRLIFSLPIIAFNRIWPRPDRSVTSVLKLQVGLLGLGRLVQRDLNRIAEKADTSTAEGLSCMLTETALALLRSSDYYVSAYSSVDVKRTLKDVKERFDQLSIEERGKFYEETLVNVNNVRKQSTTTQGDNGLSNEYIVTTILVAAKGMHELPILNRSKDLKESLQKLALIPSTRLMAVEVLWAPQEENDTMSERELLKDFPLLRPL